MTYEEFLAGWHNAFTDSRLPLRHGFPSERIDARTLDREFHASLLGANRGGRPFTVSVEFHFRWDALTTVRTTRNDEEVITALGRASGRAARVMPPWLRVDTSLHATLPWGKPLPLPSSDAWAEWSARLLDRLESKESLVPARTTRVRGGRQEVLAWQGLPQASCACNEDGELVLESVKIESWQAITLPGSGERQSARQVHPETQLEAMFTRVRGALVAWTETLRFLLPPPPARSGRGIARA